MAHDHETTKWPPGQYAVYGSEKGCPKGNVLNFRYTVCDADWLYNLINMV